MRLGGFLIISGVMSVAMSVLLEGAALVRFFQDAPRLLLPLPCEQSLPALVDRGIDLRARVDGEREPRPVTVEWSATDGNGELLSAGTTALRAGVTSTLARIPAGSRRELRVSARLHGPGQPTQAFLEVRPVEAGAAGLALSGAGLFVLGELLMGLGAVLSLWRMLTSLARPLHVRFRRLLRWFHRPRAAVKRTRKSAKSSSRGVPAAAPSEAAVPGPGPDGLDDVAPATGTPVADAGTLADTSIPGGAASPTPSPERGQSKAARARPHRRKADS